MRQVAKLWASWLSASCSTSGVFPQSAPWRCHELQQWDWPFLHRKVNFPKRITSAYGDSSPFLCLMKSYSGNDVSLFPPFFQELLRLHGEGESIVEACFGSPTYAVRMRFSQKFRSGKGMMCEKFYSTRLFCIRSWSVPISTLILRLFWPKCSITSFPCSSLICTVLAILVVCKKVATKYLARTWKK